MGWPRALLALSVLPGLLLACSSPAQQPAASPSSSVKPPSMAATITAIVGFFFLPETKDVDIKST